MRLRVLSYNIRSLRDDGAAVIRVIRDAAPDVVCVQEAPRFFRSVAKGVELARRTGLVTAVGGRACGANLLLVRLAVDVVGTRRVPFSLRRGLHLRGAAVASCRLRGVPFTVAGTHLDLVPGERLRHLPELWAAVDGLPGPLVLGGDMNETPEGPFWAGLTDRLVDAYAAAGDGDGLTYSATVPRTRIDGIFVDPAVTVVCCEALDTPDVRVASDHRPVLAELELPE
ncbi:MAG: endonuclease/exonuclease/phosphatase family protein [Mycobacteriales bacterium]